MDRPRPARQRTLSAALLFSASAGALLAMASPALALCTTTGTITFTITCSQNYGPNATASVSGSTLTVDDLTIDDPSDGVSSFSRIVLKAGTETSGAIDIGLNVTGETYIDSHNSAGIFLQTQKGDITIDVGADVEIRAQQSGIFAKADNSDSGAGGEISVTNAGIISAGTLTTGTLFYDGIRIRSLQGKGTIENTGTVTSRLGRGLRIDGSQLVAGPSVVLDDLIINNGSVNSLLDAAHVNAIRGSARIENNEYGNLVSWSQRGAVASSTYSDASIENYGTIVGEAGAGSLVWGAEDATLTNYGTIRATNDIAHTDTDFLFFGAQVWSKTSGDATLTNKAGGEIIAHDGWAAWVLSTDGDVKIDNAGTLLGESTAVYVGADQIAEQWLGTNPVLPDHAGAVGGDLTLTNSGTITADTTTDFTHGMALVTLAGYDLGTVTVTNSAGGFIGAGFAEGADFSLPSLAMASRSDFQALYASARNAALSLGVESEFGATITNAGTLVGRLSLATPYDAFGTGPDSGAAGSMSNSGIWVMSGTSTLPGTLTNSGNIFSLGDSRFEGALANSGALWVRSTTDHAANLAIAGDYAASDGAQMRFDIISDGAPLVTISGAVTGQTEVVIANVDSWDWKTYTPHTLINIDDATPGEGAGSFVLQTTDLGLVHYDLAYNATDTLWTLSTSVSSEAIAETQDLAQTVASSISTTTSDLLNRTDDLRDLFSGPDETAPIGYAPVRSLAAEQAFAAALQPADSPVVRSWAKTQSAYGTGSSYSGQVQGVTFGADISSGLSGMQLAVGAFGALTGTSLAYEVDGNSAEMAGRAIGIYGTLMNRDGVFASAVLAGQMTDIELALSGEAAQFDAFSMAGRADIGYRTAMGQMIVEPSLGLRFGASSYDDFTMSDTVVSIDSAQSTAVEARLRVSQTLALDAVVLSPFAIVTVGTSQNSNGTMTLADVGAQGVADDDGAYGSLALGLQTTSVDGRVNAYARGDLTISEQSQWSSVKVGGSLLF